MAMTIEELQRRCTDLAKQIGPNAQVWAMVVSGQLPSIGIYPDKGKSSDFLSFGLEAGDLDDAFAAANMWLAARPDPEAEWLSWQPDQFAQADTGAA